MTTAAARGACVIGSAAAACLLLAPAPTAQMSLAERLAPLALDAESTLHLPHDAWCATPHDPLSWAPGATADRRAVGADGALPDGRPLRARQFPRFLRPTHEGRFGFDPFVVIGDHGTVTFERVDPQTDDGFVAETWRRTGTDSVNGRLVSVFRPAWDASALRETLRRYAWGVDQPTLYWGRFVTPGARAGSDDDPDYVHVRLALAPPNIPTSAVERTGSSRDNYQYASHVLNVVEDDFGDSRAWGGDTDFDLAAVVRRASRQLRDQYDVIAVLGQEALFGQFGGFHQVVRNDIGGLGLRQLDRSTNYGSRGVLRGVEGYPGYGAWATWATVLHEQGHQVGDYSQAWSAIDRAGHDPDGHTPLLTPGAVLYGSVLEGKVRVGRSGQGGAYRIEPTLPLVAYNPLTLYRMGLLPASRLAPMQVFRDQDQFDEESSTTPEAGKEVTGETVEVTVNDLMAADGARSGPAIRNVRRAFVYVTRDGLAPQDEMDVVNYFARRLGESSGVTSWDRYPSFAEATGGLATMTTDVTHSGGRSAPAPAVSGRCAKVGVDALVGIRLDEEFGGCLAPGTSVDVSGTLTLTDRTDYYAVCLRFRRYGAADDDRVYVCDELNVDRFDMRIPFPADKPGGYTMEAFAFWPRSGAQYPLTSYTGAIEVLTN